MVAFDSNRDLNYFREREKKRGRAKTRKIGLCVHVCIFVCVRKCQKKESKRKRRMEKIQRRKAIMICVTGDNDEAT